MNTAQISSTDETITYPKFYAWIIFTLSALFLFYKYILQISPSVMSFELMGTFHLSGAGLGNLAASYFYAYLLIQLIAGPALDRFSPRLLTSFAIACCACGALLFSHSNSLMAAELSRGLIGVGGAFATVSYMKFTAMWFPPRQFAFVGGLLITAGMIGALFGEMPLALLIQKVGWRHSLSYCALLGVIIAALFFLLARDRKIKETQSVPFSWSVVYGLLKNKNNWLLTIYSGLIFAPATVFSGLWGNPFLQTAYHVSNIRAASLISLTFVGMALGGPMMGMLSNYFTTRFPVMIMGVLFSLISLSFIIYYPQMPIIVLSLLLLLFGFGTGSVMLGFTVGKEINCLTLAATIVALINTGDAAFGSLSEPLVGKILDLHWVGHTMGGTRHFPVSAYHIAFSILPLYLIVALVVLFILSKRLRNQ